MQVPNQALHLTAARPFAFAGFPSLEAGRGSELDRKAAKVMPLLFSLQGLLYGGQRILISCVYR